MIDRIISGRYLIRAQIGSGGMAVVYKATDTQTGNVVALKVLRREYNSDLDFIRRFAREAEAASKMFHENIVNTLDYGEDGDDRYIVMEYVEGQTLKEMIRRMGKIPPQQAVPMCIRILAAVDHAHKNNIVHRDIKPQNILVDQHGQAKVADFGIARSMRQDTNITMHDPGIALGSVHYFSPEQASGEVVDQKSDLYSVGVVLYEMLTGQLPFDGDTAISVALKHVNEDPVSMRTIEPSISKGLDEVVLRALSKDVGKRYQSAAEMAADLRRALKSPRGGFVRYPETPEEKQARRQKQKQRNRRYRNRIALSAVALAVLLSVIVIIVISVQSRRASNYSRMPLTLGALVESARTLLESNDIQCEIAYVYRDDVAAGTVVAQSALAGDWVPKNGSVTLTVCAGRSTMTVPSVLDLPVDMAQQTLTQCGAQDVRIEPVPVTEGELGVVVGQSPEAGTMDRSTPILLSVSAKACVVPPVTNISREAAELALVTAGLKVGVITEAHSQDGQPGTVISQSIYPDTTVVEGTPVDLTIVQYAQTLYYVTPMIDVVVPEGGAQVLLAVQAPSGNTTEVLMDMPEGGAHQLSLDSVESGTHIVDIYINGTWVEQISREFQ